MVNQMLDDLIKGPVDSSLLAYQIAFDLCDNSTQQFRLNVRNQLPSAEPAAAAGM